VVTVVNRSQGWYERGRGFAASIGVDVPVVERVANH
jgi:hypothetical protein